MADDTLQILITAQADALTAGMQQAQSVVSSAVDSMSSSLSDLQTAANSTDNASVKLSNSFKEIGDSAQSANSGLGSLSNNLQLSLAHIAAYVIEWEGLREVLHTIKDVASEIVFGTAELAEHLENLSVSTGISTEELQRLRFAAQLSGSDFDILQRSVSQLALKMLELQSGSSNPALETAIADLGLTPEQLSDSEHAIDNIAEAIKRVGISQRTIGDVSELLGGRGGARLIPILEKLDETSVKFHALNLLMDDETVKSAAHADEQIHTLGATWEGFEHALENSSALVAVVDRLSEMNVVAAQLASGNFESITDSIKGLALGSQEAIDQLQKLHEARINAIEGNLPADTLSTFLANASLASSPSLSAHAPTKDTSKESIESDISTFKAGEEQKIALAGDTVSARLGFEREYINFLQSEQGLALNIIGTKEGVAEYQKIQTEISQASVQATNDAKAATKESQSIQLEGARSVASNEETIAQAKFALIKAQLDQQVQSGIISRQQETTALQDATNRDYEIKAAAIAKEIALQESARGGAGPKAITPGGTWTAADEAQYQKALTDQQTLAFANQAKLTEIATAGAAEQMKVAQSTATGEIQIAQARYALLQAQLQQQVQAGIITRQQESADLIDAENRDYASKMQALDNDIAMLPIGTAALQDALNKRFELELAYQTKVTQLQTEAQKGFAFQGVFASVGEDFNSLIDSMLKGTEKVRVEFQNLARSLVEGGIKTGIEGLFTGGGGAAGGPKGLTDVLFGGGLSGVLAKLISPTGTGAASSGGAAASSSGSFGLVGSLVSKGGGAIENLLGLGGGGNGGATGGASPFASITTAFSTALDQMKTSAGSWVSSVLGVLKGLVPGFSTAIDGIKSLWQAIAPAAAAAAGAQKAIDLSTVQEKAGLAAAAQFAAVIVATPFPENLALAPQQAAQAFATTEAFGAISAEGGALLGPQGSIAVLHPREMVLPANLSEGLQKIISSGSIGRDSGSFTHHEENHFHISAMDSESFRDFVTKTQNAGHVATAVSVADRNGHPALRNFGRTTR